MQQKSQFPSPNLKAKNRLRQILKGLALASATGYGVIAIPAHAQDATWDGINFDWNTDSNWNPAQVPTNSAIFSDTGQPAVTTSSDVSINQMLFQSNAEYYNITNNNTFTINGTGISNNSSSNEDIYNLGTLIFNNSATISESPENSQSIAIRNGADAESDGGFGYGSAGDNGGVVTGGNGQTTFNDSASAGSVVLYNGGSAAASGGGGVDGGTGGAGGFATGGNGSVDFNDNSLAGSATIINGGNATAQGGYGYSGGTGGAGGFATGGNGIINFNDNSSANSADIYNGGSASASGGGGTGTGGAGGFATGGNGIINFNNNSSAGSSTITNTNEAVASGGSLYSGGVGGAGGVAISGNATINFNDSSTAASSDISNNGYTAADGGSGAVGNGVGGNGGMSFGGSSIINFNDSTTASTATFHNNGYVSANGSYSPSGGTSGAGGYAEGRTGTITFNDFSTAADSQFYISHQASANGGSTQGGIAGNGGIAIASSTTINFNDSSTSANATFSISGYTNATGGSGDSGGTGGNGGGTISNGNSINFNDSSTASASTFYNSGGFAIASGGNSSGGTGGNGGVAQGDNSAINFYDSSTAGAAKFQNAGGSANSSGGDSFNGGTGGDGGVAIGGNATLSFFDSSNAQNADIINKGGTAGSSYGNGENGNLGGAPGIVTAGLGITTFNNTSAAGQGTGGMNAVITNQSGGLTRFNDSSSAAAAALVNESTGYTEFNDSSSAGNAVIINNSGGVTYFNEDSTADTAIIFNNKGALVDASGVVTGTDKVLSIGALTGAGDVDITGVTLTLGNLNSSDTISGVIYDNTNTGGSGNLVKTGTGVLTLSGLNTFTGTTTVQQGTLNLDGNSEDQILQSSVTVDSGAFLTGRATINNDLTVNGTIAPGRTNAPFGGITARNFTLSSTSDYEVSVDANGNRDFVESVVGTGTLQGGELSPQDVGGGIYGRRTVYNIAYASQGYTGQFGTIDESGLPSYLDASVDYSDPNYIYLILVRNSTGFEELGSLSENQRNVVKVLNAAYDPSNPDPNPIFDAIFLSANQRQALSEASGDSQTVYPVILQNAVNRFNEQLWGAGAGGQDQSQYAAGPDLRLVYSGDHFSSVLNGTRLAQSGSEAATTGSVSMPSATERSNIWATIGRAKDNGDSDGNGPGFDASATEYSTGYSRRVGAKTIAGIAVGKSDGNVNVESRSAEGDLDTTSLGAFIHHEGNSFYAKGLISYGRHSVESDRTVAGNNVSADFDARTLSAWGEVGKRYGKGRYRLEPNVSLKLSNTRSDDYQESGIGGLSVDSASYNTRRFGLGLRLVSANTTSRLRPYGFVGYEREFGDTSVTLNNTLPGIGSFNVKGSELGKNIFSVRLGTGFNLNERLSLVGEVGASLRQNQDSKYIYGGVKYGF